MSSFFKGIALFVAITCGVWIAVLWRWQVTSRDMNTPDIVVYLGVLPLTVFALALLLRWAWRGAAERQAATAAAAVAAPGAVVAAAGNTTAEEVRRHATVQLLAAHLGCAAGGSAADVLSAAKEGKPRPGLDAELRDDNGLPLFSARIPDLDVEASTAALTPCIAASQARQPEWAGLALPEHVRRALTALQQPLLDAAAALAPWSTHFAVAPDAPRGSAPERRVRVLLGWPAGWTAFEQEVARAFAIAVLSEEGHAPVPAACFAVTALAGSGEELLLQADRLLQTLAREGRDELLLVAACHSSIGADAVDALERAGVLFSAATRPKGSIPGEAAAALLLAGADWPADPDRDAPPVHLHRPVVVQRDKPVDAPGRVGSDSAVLAMTQALAASRLGATAMAALAVDADQHTARAAEMHGAALGVLPQLDAAEDLRLLATVTGAVGAAGTLIVVACAAEAARSAGKPCLAATFGDTFARLALVALPGPPQPVAAAAATPTAAAGAA